jgi:2-polyprenyl-6-hydroxyphenyl methylase/3-demethylubiquinone-9 3-methyltransferase
MFRSLVRSQIFLSQRFDALLPDRFRIDGNRDFFRLAKAVAKPGMTVWDVGGGKQPFFSPQEKKDLQLNVVGLDINRQELAAAPLAAYDRTVVADICKFTGYADADLVICQALLEHVPDTAAAFAAISSILKSGGKAIIFTPSRNAVFAMLNLLLPEALKRQMLFAFYPEARHQQGFPAYYDRCTVLQFHHLAEAANLQIAEQWLYYQSAYLNFAFPLHLLWRIWLLFFAAVAPRHAAETFTLLLVKQS